MRAPAPRRPPWHLCEPGHGAKVGRAPPTIQALGITHEGAPTRCKATGYVEGVGWLEAGGTSLINAMEVLQVLAARRVAPQEEENSGC